MVRPYGVGIVAIVLMATAPTVVTAQTLGYALGGPIICGKTCALWYVGGGGEKLSGPAGFGAELGVLGSPGGSVSVGLLSLHATSYAVNGNGPRPFVTGGYSFFVGAPSAAGLWSVGAGADWWRARHTGFRFEVRATGLSLGARLGVVFR
jgi:hypothetical protein